MRVRRWVVLVVMAAGIAAAVAGVASGAGAARRPGAPASIQITPDPLKVACARLQPMDVEVRLLDRRGNPVANGTVVEFQALVGHVDPAVDTTRRGVARTTIVPEPYGGLLQIEAGDLQVQVSVQCNDDPLGDCYRNPTSPPCVGPTPTPCDLDPTSPPCFTPTPTPGIPDCAFSPPVHPMSPPCVTPTPTPEPPCNDEFFLSPPCGTPTPTGPCGQPGQPPCDTRFGLVVDCDLANPGVQDACPIPFLVSQLSVGLVFQNRSGSDTNLTAFNFELHNSSTALLFPSAGADANLNANPDFHEASFVAENWACTPPAPKSDTGMGAPGTSISFLSCFSGSGTNLTVVPDGEDLLVATVTFDIAGTLSAGVVDLGLSTVSVGNVDGIALIDCWGEHGYCRGATLTASDPTPTPVVIAAVTATPTTANGALPPVATRTRRPR